MGDAWQPSPPNVSPPPGMEGVTFYSRTPVPLVLDKVRHAGESLAVVIAENRYIAEDAVDGILGNSASWRSSGRGRALGGSGAGSGRDVDGGEDDR